MTDLVERLRHFGKGESDYYAPSSLCIEAADEIERLRIDVELLKELTMPINLQQLQEIGAVVRRFKDVEQ